MFLVFCMVNGSGFINGAGRPKQHLLQLMSIPIAFAVRQISVRLFMEKYSD